MRFADSPGGRQESLLQRQNLHSVAAINGAGLNYYGILAEHYFAVLLAEEGECAQWFFGGFTGFLVHSDDWAASAGFAKGNANILWADRKLFPVVFCEGFTAADCYIGPESIHSKRIFEFLVELLKRFFTDYQQWKTIGKAHDIVVTESVFAVYGPSKIFFHPHQAQGQIEGCGKKICGLLTLVIGLAVIQPDFDRAIFRPSTVLGGALPMAAGGVSAANQYFLEIRELNAAENIQ